MQVFGKYYRPVELIKNLTRVLLGILLIFAGISHLGSARQEFQLLVPDWVPIGKDLTVVVSGIAEIGLGIALIFWVRKKIFWGWVVAVFFLIVFTGNIAQFIDHRNAFGLDTDLARGIRLLFQPLLIVWALWSTNVLR